MQDPGRSPDDLDGDVWGPDAFMGREPVTSDNEEHQAAVLDDEERR